MQKRQIRTQQQFKDECDVNNVVRRYAKTNFVDPSVNPSDKPFFGDFTATDFQDSMNLVVEAQERFMRLDARVRDRFNNNPVDLLKFVEDGRNYEEALKLGLVKPREVVKKDEPLATPPAK